MELFVGNLPWSMTDDQLSALFSAHGKVDRAKIVMDRDTGRSRGFAFVTMSSDAEATAAVNALNNTQQGGRPMTVRKAEPRQGGPGPRGPGGPGGGGGGRDRY